MRAKSILAALSLSVLHCLTASAVETIADENAAFGFAALEPGMGVDELLKVINGYGMSAEEQRAGVSYLSLIVDARTRARVEVTFLFGSSGLQRVSLVARGDAAAAQSQTWRDGLQARFGKPARRVAGGGDLTYCLSNKVEISVNGPKPFATSAGLAFTAYGVPTEACSAYNASEISAPAYALANNQSGIFGDARPVGQAEVASFQRTRDDPSLQAAKQGDAVAQHRLGQSYLRRQEYGGALEWFQKSAAQGNAQAILSLGQFYVNGWVVQQDASQAVALYKKAAALGVSEAMYNIGLLYREGGVRLPKDLALSDEWLRKAAASGDKDANSRMFDNDRERQEKVFLSQKAERAARFATPEVRRCIRISAREIGASSSRDETPYERQRRGAILDTGRQVTTSSSYQNYAHNTCNTPVTAYFECELVKGGATPMVLVPGKQYVDELPGDFIFGVEHQVHRSSKAPNPSTCR